MNDKDMIELLVNAINQGTKKFSFEEAPFLHQVMGKYMAYTYGFETLEDLLDAND